MPLCILIALQIYQTLQQSVKDTGKRIDLLLVCGDFQARFLLPCGIMLELRTAGHPQCGRSAMPGSAGQVQAAWFLSRVSLRFATYKVLMQCGRYYSGKAKAPMLTIVIGGNHEASNYMWEL
jgi:lariat debranching enzyme